MTTGRINQVATRKSKVVLARDRSSTRIASSHGPRGSSRGNQGSVTARPNHHHHHGDGDGGGGLAHWLALRTVAGAVLE